MGNVISEIVQEDSLCDCMTSNFIHQSGGFIHYLSEDAVIYGKQCNFASQTDYSNCYFKQIMKIKFIIGIIALFATNFSSFAKSEVKQPDSYAYTRGVEAFNEGKNQDAFDWFTKELQDHPDNGYAYVYVSGIYAANDEYGKALSAIDNALKKIPKKDKEWRVNSLGVRSAIYLCLQDTIKGLQDLDAAEKIDPANWTIYNSRGQIYYEQGKYALSDADYQSMIRLDQGDTMGYMGVGRNANAEKRWDDAISQFDHVIRLSPEYSSGYSFRAEAFIGQEKWNEATDDIVKALDIDGDSKALFLMANLPQDATSLLKTKLKIQMTKQSTNNFWPYCLAILSESKEDYASAIEYYEKANSIDANPIFLNMIAKCYSKLEDYDKALDYADRALAMSTDDSGVRELKADILSSLGRYEDSISEWDGLISKNPENPLSYLSRAECQMSAHNFDKAIEDYDTAVVLSPELSKYPYLLMKRGDAYRLLGKQDEARRDYEKLLECEKDSVLTGNSWTPFAYSGLGNADKAIETMQYILSNDTTDVAGNLYNKACIYARLGQKSEAIKYLKEAFENGYKHTCHMESDYDLDEVREMPEYKELIESAVKEDAIPIIDASLVKDETGVYETVEVPFTKEGGITKVKCSINGLPLHFVFDTGAAEVTMSMVEANFMLKNDYIKPDDIIGSARYIDANGDVSEGTVINLKNVNFGGLELDNVRASVVRNQKAPLLLGQSVLGRLGKIEIDNPGLKLVITHKTSK